MCWNNKHRISQEISDLSHLGWLIQQEDGDEEIVFNKKDVLAYLSQLIAKYQEIQDFRSLIEKCETENRLLGYVEDGHEKSEFEFRGVDGSIEKAKQQYGLEGDREAILKKLHKLMDKFPPPPREFKQGMGDRIDLLNRLYKAGTHSAYKKVN
jgi:hypothetical protein